MAETFRCPSCSAPLEFEGKMMQKCKFCQSNVIVPASVMQNSNDFGDLSALTGKALQIAEIQKLIQSDQKIYAIKLFRETFGVGLKEAKDSVDEMEAGKSIDISGMRVKTAGFQASPKNAQTLVKKGFNEGRIIWLVFFIFMFFISLSIAITVFFSLYFDNFIGNVSNYSENKTEAETPQSRTPENLSIAQEILKFGGEGIGAGKFKDNRTIATDANGKIYSADFSGGRIQIFDANGNFQTQITSDTTKTVDALGTDRKGNLFVLQGYDLYRFKAESGENLGKTQINSASDLAIGLDGKIYVSTWRGEIQIFDAEGAKLKTIQIGKDLNFTEIRQIAVDGAGNIFALDGKTFAIFKLAPDGKLLTRFVGRDNKSKAMFSVTPYDLAVDSQGRIYASQVSRISIFDTNGNFLNEFKTTQAFGMTFNDAGELFVASRPFVVKYKLNL